MSRVTLEQLRSSVDEYSTKFRKEGLPKVVEGEIYSLDQSMAIRGVNAKLFWPDDYWPNTDRRGVYAIFFHERLLYIGKASQQDLGYRLSTYFRKEAGTGRCVTTPGYSWTDTDLPTHVVTWAVPECMPFEASALEEYLIERHSPPDNTLGVGRK